MAAMFYIASVVFYIHSRLKNNQLYYLCAFMSGVLSMLTKEIAFTLPIILLLVQALFFESSRRNAHKIFINLLPFFLLMLLIPLLRTYYSTSSKDVFQTMLETTAIPRSHYLLTQLNVIRTYLRLVFFPANQNIDYDYPISTNLFEVHTFASLLLIIGILVIAFKILKHHKLIGFGIFWFFITLSVESTLIPI